MLNADYADQTRRDYKQAEGEYERRFQQAARQMSSLTSSRQRAVRSIQQVERYVLRLAKRPRDIETKMGQIRIQYTDFNNRYHEIQAKVSDPQSTMGGGVAGALGGLAISTLSPAVATSVAMTFGTTSTGVAISSLSGAAAMNAAMAWIGGGTLAAGGAGIAGGQAILAAAGPVGLLIAGGSLVAAFGMTNHANRKQAEQYEQGIQEVKRQTERIREIEEQVKYWNSETIRLSNELSSALIRVRQIPKYDCETFTDSEIAELTALLNSAEVLSKKIGETLDTNE